MIAPLVFGFVIYVFGLMTPYVFHRYIIPMIKRKIKNKVKKWK